MVGRKDRNDSRHGLDRIQGVEGRHDQVTGLSSGQRRLDRFKVPDFTDENHIRVLPESHTQCG